MTKNKNWNDLSVKEKEHEISMELNGTKSLKCDFGLDESFVDKLLADYWVSVR